MILCPWDIDPDPPRPTRTVSEGGLGRGILNGPSHSRDPSSPRPGTATWLISVLGAHLGEEEPSQVPAGISPPSHQLDELPAFHSLGPSALCWPSAAALAELVNFRVPAQKSQTHDLSPVVLGGAQHPKPVHRPQVKFLHCPPRGLPFPLILAPNVENTMLGKG